MAGGLTLNVDTLSKIPTLEKALKSGRINIVLVFAEWCGACHKFRNNIWNPMLKKGALHNRIAVRDDMINKTSLANTKFDYLPSILIVDEKGVAQTFKTPEGKVTNAMPTPKNIGDMTRVVNVPVATANVGAEKEQEEDPSSPGVNTLARDELQAQLETFPANIAVRKNLTPVTLNSNVSQPLNAPLVPAKAVKPLPANKAATPEGAVFTPTPFAAPQRGGNLLVGLESAARGAIPATVLGSLVFLMRGGGSKRLRKTKRRAGKVDRRTRKHK